MQSTMTFQVFPPSPRLLSTFLILRTHCSPQNWQTCGVTVQQTRLRTSPNPFLAFPHPYGIQAMPIHSNSDMWIEQSQLRQGHPWSSAPANRAAGGSIHQLTRAAAPSSAPAPAACKRSMLLPTELLPTCWMPNASRGTSRRSHFYIFWGPLYLVDTKNNAIKEWIEKHNIVARFAVWLWGPQSLALRAHGLLGAACISKASWDGEWPHGDCWDHNLNSAFPDLKCSTPMISRFHDCKAVTISLQLDLAAPSDFGPAWYCSCTCHVRPPQHVSRRRKTQE